ncbi:hypothetical protein ACFE04_010532 [Oxalis oulophora]
MNAPRRKPRRPSSSGQFKPVGSSLDDFDSSPKNGEATTLSFFECDGNGEGVGGVFFSRGAFVVGVAEVTHEANPEPSGVNVEGEGNLEEVQALMLEVLGAEKGVNDNARVGFDVRSNDEDMDAEDEAKMDVKKKVVAKDLVRGVDEDQTSEFLRRLSGENQLQCVLSHVSEGLMHVALRQICGRATSTNLKDEDINGLFLVRYEERAKMLEERDVHIDELSSQLLDLKKRKKLADARAVPDIVEYLKKENAKLSKAYICEGEAGPFALGSLPSFSNLSICICTIVILAKERVVLFVGRTQDSSRHGQFDANFSDI